MNFKFAWAYFVGLTLLLIILFGYIGWHGNDAEYRHYTAVRMHACDILKNDRSTLKKFEPEKCEVTRRNVWVGELIDVTCTAIDAQREEHRFSQTYSDGHLLFRYVFDKTYALRNGGYCHA